jgi:hypothetical protein
MKMTTAIVAAAIRAFLSDFRSTMVKLIATSGRTTVIATHMSPFIVVSPIGQHNTLFSLKLCQSQKCMWRLTSTTSNAFFYFSSNH